jgi:imidazolonepropionase
MKLDLLLTNARIATMRGAGLGIIDHGSIGIANGRIAWIAEGKPDADCKTRDLGGAWVTPGLIDCHTHLVFAGNRAAEFEMRLKGATYEEIAKAGGGIRSTVNATRAATEDELFKQSAKRLSALIAEGVTTVEIKSGYGLDLASELKQLRVARRLGRELPVNVRTTFLGAHALPPEFAGRQADYVEHIVNVMLPAVAAEGLADAVDAFCENIAFTPAETSRIFAKARELGLKVKLHADQLSDGGGGALAASFDALSADHLEWTNESGIAAMAKAGTVAVMLPGAFYCLRETKLPPIDLMRKHGVAMAVASDLNPGTSPIVSLQANMHMACTLFRMTPEEVLRGVTVNAARAVGLEDRGVVDVGLRADLAVWDVESVVELTYWMCGMRPLLTSFNGVNK